ncbi:MAG: MogA/MoaB family molybdenum cofactor biosynthesis protein [Nitrososphaerota archaeon]|jgi:molybdenum cofactor biosynthesis protein B|nr:MogA/MoaB family molybdenum cofactor biosynthesis protein [Nitrososphaerota archaeon]
MSKTSKQHKEQLAQRKINFAIYICSTSRYNQLKEKGGVIISDEGGEIIQKLIQTAGHIVLYKKILADDKALIVEAFEDSLARWDLDVTIFSGGTGIAPADVTIEAVLPLLEKTLPGFGELFRHISYSEIGSATMLSRAIAGVAGGKVFFCIPGSPNAVKTAVEKLVLPEVPHIIKHIRE